MVSMTREEAAEWARVRGKAPPGPSAKRRAGGRKARAAGDAWETVCTAPSVHVSITRVPNGMRVIGHTPAGKPRLIPQPAPFDYAGTLRVPDALGIFRAHPLFFDAKSVGDDATCPLNNPKLFKPHQIIELLAQHRMGAAAGFLVRSERADAVLWLDANWAAELRAERLPWDSPAWFVMARPFAGRVPWEVLARRYT